MKKRTLPLIGWHGDQLRRDLAWEFPCISSSRALASAHLAVYSLTRCVLSKREYPGFSWIYFKVNLTITSVHSPKHFVADFFFVEWMIVSFAFVFFPLVYFALLISGHRSGQLLAVTLVCFLGQPAPRLPHQPHWHWIGHWIPHGRGVPVQLHQEEIPNALPQSLRTQTSEWITVSCTLTLTVVSGSEVFPGISLFKK